MNRILTIVVAAGRGQRMRSELPKQFLLLDGKPVVMHTLERIREAVGHAVEAIYPGCSPIVENSVNNLPPEEPDVDKTCKDPEVIHTPVHNIVLLLPADYMELWQELCRKYSFDVPHRVVAGGDTRFASVNNGLRADPDADVVLVHDGVRPFPGDFLVEQVLRGVLCHGAAVPAIEVTDSLRWLEGKDDIGGTAVDRSQFRAVQTPQGFGGEWLRAAYAGGDDSRFTDDASVLEIRTGRKVVMTPGEPSNIKITSRMDLAAAEAWIRMHKGD